MQVQVLWVVGLFEKCFDTGSRSGISVESCTKVSKPWHPWPPWVYEYHVAISLLDFLDHPVMENRGRVMHRIQDPNSLCSGHLCPMHVGLGLETSKVEACGLNKWQKDLHEE